MFKWDYYFRFETEELVAVGGCAPLPNKRGWSPWLLATDGLDDVKFSFARYNRGFIKSMLGRYGYLENYVHDKNGKSKKWLDWCGFRFDEPAPWGPHGEMFRRFWMTTARDGGAVV